MYMPILWTLYTMHYMTQQCENIIEAFSINYPDTNFHVGLGGFPDSSKKVPRIRKRKLRRLHKLQRRNTLMRFSEKQIVTSPIIAPIMWLSSSDISIDLSNRIQPQRYKLSHYDLR